MRNILLTRFDTFGDIVLLEGFVELLASLPSVERITLLVREGYNDLAPLFPSNVHWLTTELQPYTAFQPSDQAKLDNLLDLLGKHEFDTLIVSTYNRTWIDDLVAARLVNAKRVVLAGEFKRPAWADDLHAQLGLSTFNLYDSEVRASESSSEITKYQILADFLFKGVGTLPSPQLSIPSGALEQVAQVLEAKGMKVGGYFTCVVTCTPFLPQKSWPPERFAEIMEWIQSEYRLSPLLLGHVSESKQIEEVVSIAKASGLVPGIWLGQKGELALLAALIQKSKFYFGSDTGPMHIAAALGVPTVGIFGGGHWPRFLPVGVSSIGIAAELPCFGCNWGDCVFDDAPCVKLVTIDDVKAAIKLILSQKTIVSNYFPVMSDYRTRFKNLRDNCSEVNSKDFKRLESDNAGLVDKLFKVQSSLSWRITKPLRWLGDKLSELGYGKWGR